MRLLTKSKYLIGLECPLFLWRLIHEPKEEFSAADRFKLEEGNKVGELAKTLFKNGINIPVDDFKENLSESKKLLKENKPLFEAGFKFKDCFSRADILIPEDNGWSIIEVKSGTKVKDINLHDVAFQKYVYEGNGIKIDKCYLMCLNKDYIRKGEININELFLKEDITEKVNEINVERNIKEVIKVFSLEEPPKPRLKKFFKDGYHDCFNDGCIELPENNVFCLYRGGKLSFELFENGIFKIKNIPKNIKLSDKQKIQKECEIKNRTYIDKEKLKQFLRSLNYPIYYLDFETFSTAIPMFDGLRPYSQVPFQFSLHIAEKGEVKHYSFLYNGNSDPRKEFILELKKVIGEKGTVLIYNQSFEIGRLKELAEYYPEHKKWIEKVLKRIVDLLIPFREFSYYNPKQQGSASIKEVLPALCGKSYDDIEIGDGGTASVMFYNMAYGNCSEEEKKKIRENLLKYCELDTMAEVMIVERLKELSVHY